jgi:hypothetical protein
LKTPVVPATTTLLAARVGFCTVEKTTPRSEIAPPPSLVTLLEEITALFPKMEPAVPVTTDGT